MLLPKPLFLKSTLNRISDISFFFFLFPYFQPNKETGADTQGQILLLRELQKIRVYYKKPNELFLLISQIFYTPPVGIAYKPI